MSNENRPNEDRPELVASSRVPAGDAAAGIRHLADNRRLIVRRALLASAVGGVIPVPVLDDYFSGRVKAGMLMKLAERRRVDIAPSSAELLGDPREGSALMHWTLGAAALVAIKLAWKKFFALLALGRRAEEMATSFQLGMLFDHYCAKLHVGAGIDRQRAMELRAAIFGAVMESERTTLISAFRDGSRVLGRSVLEAPTWFGDRVQRAAQRWAESGGQTADPGDTIGGVEGEGMGDGGEEEARWLDRATAEVESRLHRVEQSYLVGLVGAFERRWQAAEARRAEAQHAKAAPSDGTG